MHGFSSINHPGRIPALPPSYEAVQQERFDQTLAQAVEVADRFIATSDQPLKFARALVKRLIEKYELQLSSASSASSAIQNTDYQLDPDQLDWIAWEKKYYTINTTGSYSEKPGLDILLLSTDNEIGKSRLDELKGKCSKSLSMLGGRGKIYDCKSFLDITTLCKHQMKAVTPILRECTQHGFFSPEFIIEKLFKDV